MYGPLWALIEGVLFSANGKAKSPRLEVASRRRISSARKLLPPVSHAPRAQLVQFDTILSSVPLLLADSAAGGAASCMRACFLPYRRVDGSNTVPADPNHLDTDPSHFLC